MAGVAAPDSEPDVHEDYVSAYDLGRFAESARFVRHYPEQNRVLGDLLPRITAPTQVGAGRNDGQSLPRRVLTMLGAHALITPPV